MATTKTTTCKRCGSSSVAWVQSKRTSRYYLAFCTPTHSLQIDGRSYGETGMQAHPHIPHDCAEPNRGGYKACEFCGRHHNQRGPWGADATPEYCTRYPDAK